MENINNYQGQPTTYNANADCQAVVEYGKLGYSKAQIASALNVSKQTLLNWVEKHVAFKEAMELSTTHAQAWWEGVGQGALHADKFQGSVYNKAITCRFRDDYGEITESIIKNAPKEAFRIGADVEGFLKEAIQKINEEF